MKRAGDLLDDAQDSLGAAQDLLLSQRWASQQAAELALKAALHALGKERKGHDVHRLVEELGQDVPGVLAFMDEARVLDQYYIPTRYMNAFAEGSARSHYTEGQARQAVAMAEGILARMREVVREHAGSGS